jgi:hypothetical protein
LTQYTHFAALHQMVDDTAAPPSLTTIVASGFTPVNFRAPTTE